MLPKFLFRQVLGRPLWLWLLVLVTIAIIVGALRAEGAYAAPEEEGKATINCALRVSYPTTANPYPALTNVIMRAGETVEILWRGLPQDALLWGPSGRPADWVMVRTGRGAEGWVSNECFGWQVIVPATPTPTPTPIIPTPVPQVVIPQQIAPLVQQPAYPSAAPSYQSTISGTLATLDEPCSIRPTTQGGTSARSLAKLSTGAQVAILGYAGEGSCDIETGVKNCDWLQVADPASGTEGVMHLTCLVGWQSLAGQFSATADPTPTFDASGPYMPTLAENYTVWQPKEAKAAESAASAIRPPELPADYTHVGSQVYVNPANAPVPVQCFSGQAIREVSNIPRTPIAISFRPDEPIFGRSWAYTVPATETPAHIYDPAIARGLGIAQLPGVHHIEFVQRVSSQVRPPGKLTAMVIIHELIHLGWIEVGKLPVSRHDEGVITDITNQYADSHASLPFYGILTCEDSTDQRSAPTR